jgi:hypothetical protein
MCDGGQNNRQKPAVFDIEKSPRRARFRRYFHKRATGGILTSPAEKCDLLSR